MIRWVNQIEVKKKNVYIDLVIIHKNSLMTLLMSSIKFFKDFKCNTLSIITQNSEYNQGPMHLCEWQQQWFKVVEFDWEWNKLTSVTP